MSEKNPWHYWVTLYADASFHSDRGGAYGFRVRSSEEPIRAEHSDVIPDCKDNNYAEMYAILQGIQYICDTYARVDGVGVRTDSQTACSLLKYQAPLHHRKDFAEIQKQVIALLAAKSAQQGSVIRIKLEWVKGHQATNNGKGWLNNRVDALARQASHRI